MKKDFIPATKDMLQQAADGELVLFAPARRHTAKLRAFPWAVAPTQSNRSCAAGPVPITPQLAEELLCFPDAQLKSYLAVDPTDCPPWHQRKDHYWVLDEPQTITREQIQGVIPANAPAAKGKDEADTSPSGDGVEEQAAAADDHDETLAALFNPVPVEALEKMFPAGGKWKSWAEKAASNGLKNARTERAKFNPYIAAVWFMGKGIAGWDLAHCNRVLANNLPARSRDDAHLLTGGIG